MKENVRYFITTYKNHKKAAFNPYDPKNYDSFVFDFSKGNKIVLNQNPRNYTILDLSHDGLFALTCQNEALTKDRKFRMIDIESGEILFEISDFYVYEAKFSMTNDILLCRANINGNSKLFIYNLLDNRIEYSFPNDSPISSGCFNYDKNIYMMPDHEHKSKAYMFDFNSLEGKEAAFKDSALIKRIVHYENETYIVIDSSATCVCYKHGVSKWITKLEGYIPAHMPMFYALHGVHRIFFDTAESKEKNISREKIPSLFIKDGKIDNIILPKSENMDKIAPFYNSSVIDAFGKIFDIKKHAISHFPMEKYC